ncbi:MAG: hypothetical protein H6727_13275 [Myxococcales bacterium]|nr:hypothetical protein [Myxococcales bacterium]
MGRPNMRVFGVLMACLGWVWMGQSGCRREATQVSSSMEKAVRACKREAILGLAPRLGDACMRERDCGSEQSAWRKCLAGRCLVSSTKEEQGHVDAVRAVVFMSPRVIASGDASGVIWLWRRDGTTWKTWRRWRAHQAAISALALGPLGQLISGGGAEVRIWDLRTKGLAGRWLVRGEVQALAWSAKRRMLAVSSTDRLVRWRAWPESQQMKKPTKEGWLGEEKTCDVIRDLAWESGPLGRLAGVGDDGLLYVWPFQKGRSIRYLAGHRGWVRRVRWWGHMPLTTGFDQTMRLWDLKARTVERFGKVGASLPLVLEKVKRCLAGLRIERPLEKLRRGSLMFQGDPLGLAAMPKRGLVWLGSHQEAWLRYPDRKGVEVSLWSMNRQRWVCRTQEHLLGVRDIALSPQGKRWVSASDDGTLRVYRLHPSKTAEGTSTKGRP